MKTYKVKVIETHYCERTYYINADNKTKARADAKSFLYIDPYSKESWLGSDKVKVISVDVDENDLTEHGFS